MEAGEHIYQLIGGMNQRHNDMYQNVQNYKCSYDIIFARLEQHTSPTNNMMYRGFDFFKATARAQYTNIIILLTIDQTDLYRYYYLFCISLF